VKITVVTKTLAILLCSTYIIACTTPMSDSRAATSVNVTSKDIIFEKGKLIEIAYFSVDKNKQQQLSQHYFPKVIPLLQEYKAKMLVKFEVKKIAGGEIKPKMIAIFEWPSLAVKVKFENDSRYKKVKPIRDEALRFLKLGYFEVAETTEITFRQDKVYEFFGAWLNKGSEKTLKKYFQVSGPIKKNYGRPEPIFKVLLKVVANAPQRSNTYSPHMSGIVEWDQSEDFFLLMENKEFKKNAAPLMSAAVARIDLLHATLIVQ